MRTLGIDLASQPGNTGLCLLRWNDGRATVGSRACDLDDQKLLDAIAGADAVGIDCPFGWPEAFVRALVEHHDGAH